MKKILCYGDSNTYGLDAYHGRIQDAEQWPNILQSSLLPLEYKVIQEGLGGRFAGDMRTNKVYQNGRTSFDVIVRSTLPAEIVIIALGTNDCKREFSRTAREVADDLLWYSEKTQEIARQFSMDMPEILYILPANFRESEYFKGNTALRDEIIAIMKKSGMSFVEINGLELSEDGVHYSIADHKKVAEIVRDKIIQMERQYEI